MDTTLREKIARAIMSRPHLTVEEMRAGHSLPEVQADAILQIPEIKAGQEALMERRINAMSPSQFGAMLLDQLPDAQPKT